MDKTTAIIRKVGSQFCIFSESGNKRLGCYKTKEAAIKRLKQIEFFKNKGSDMSENKPFEDKFEEAMSKFGEELVEGSELEDDPSPGNTNYSKEPKKNLKPGKQLPDDPADRKSVV